MARLSRTTTSFLSPYSFSFRHPATAGRAVVVPFSETESQFIATATVDAQAQSAQVFEAIAPDTSLVVAFGSVLVLCIAAGFVWANDVVPVSRTKLAISKSRGKVREYLDDLKNNDDISLYDLNSTTVIPVIEQAGSIGETPQLKNIGDDGRGFERWLFSDWLNDKPGISGGRKKEPALPILKNARWNSGDNPVLVTVAIMMLGVIVASVTERIAT